MRNDDSTFSDAPFGFRDDSFGVPQEGVEVVGQDPNEELEDVALSEEGVSTPVSQSPFVNRLRGTASGQVVVRASPGSFSPKNKQQRSPAGSLLNARMSTNRNAPQVGGELRENEKRLRTFKEMEEKMEKDAADANLFKDKGFGIHINGHGETVISIPPEYQETIISQATDELRRTLEKQYTERLDVLVDYFGRLESARKDISKLPTPDLNKRISTIETILSGAKKDRDQISFKRALSVAEDNLQELEDIIAREQKTLATIEKNKRKVDTEAVETKNKEMSDALRAAQKAQEGAELATQKAYEELAGQKEALVRIQGFYSHLVAFREKQSLSERILPLITDQLVSTALESGARDLNELSAKIFKTPSTENINQFITKLTAYSSLIDTAEKNESAEIIKPVEVSPKKQDEPRFFGTMDGWPSIIKQEKGASSPSWVLVSEDGKVVYLFNSALWSTLASNYDDAFKLYQDFLEGNNQTESIEKMKLYHALVLRKNELNAALLNLDTDRAAELITSLKQSIEDADKNWKLYQEEENKKTLELKRQKDLLDRLKTCNVRYDELATIEESLKEYTVESDVQRDLEKAKDLVTSIQQESAIFETKPETITDDFVNKYRGAIEEVNKLLVARKEEKEEAERLLQEEHARVMSIFESTKDNFTHIEDVTKALLERISSAQENDIVQSRLQDIKNERTKLENAGTDITEEMVKLHAKHIRDFNTMLSSAKTREDNKGTQNPSEGAVNDATYKQPKEDRSFVDTPIVRTLNSDGTLTTDEGTSSGAPLDLTTLKEKGDKEKEIAFLAQHFDREYRKDPESFKNYFHSTILNLDATDKNRLAAEMVVANIIREIENKIKDIEAKQTERNVKTEDGQLKDLEQRRAEELVRRLRREIDYLVKADTKPNIEESKPVNQPFKNRLKFSGVRSVKSAANDASYEQEAPTVSEEAPAKVQSEPAADVTVKEPTIESVPTNNVQATLVNQNEKEALSKGPEPLEAGASERNEAVVRIIDTLFNTKNTNLERILSPTGNVSKPAKITQTESTSVFSPETLGQFASWKNFPEIEAIKPFVNDFSENKLGLKLMVWEYAEPLREDTGNTSSLATITNTDVYNLINGDGGAYGHDESKRTKLSDIIVNLDLIARATTSGNQNTIQGDKFSSLRKNETFENYYSRVLHLAEQTNLKEKADRARARERQDMLKKAA